MQKDITLAQARTLYEDHFKRPMPKDLSYINAATAVLKEVGWDTLMDRLDTILKEEWLTAGEQAEQDAGC